MGAWFWRVLIAIDQFANVFLGPLLNVWVKEGGAEFGKNDETLSSVMGKNMATRTCPVCDWICMYILNPLDPGHCHKSIETDEGDPYVGDQEKSNSDGAEISQQEKV